jgi:DNA repair exonuclease SbcCD ATPase subunit
MEMERKRLEAQAKAAEDTKRRLKRDKEMEKKRLEALDKYRRELQEVDDDLDQAKRTMEYAEEQESQLKELKEKKERLKEMQESLKVQQKQKQQQSKASISKSALPRFNSGSSDAKDSWEFQKVHEGAHSAALDEIMELIGLESVKQEFLLAKNMVDTKIRQGVSLSDERFSCSLLGNPGTGKFDYCLVEIIINMLSLTFSR